MNIKHEKSSANVSIMPTHPPFLSYNRTKSGKIVKTQRSMVFNTNMLKKTASIDNWTDVLKTSDLDFDMEFSGKYISKTNQIVVDEKLNPVNSYSITESLTRPDGSVETRDYIRYERNIDKEIPVVISNKLFDPREIFLSYIFRKSYYMIHTDPISYEVLYNIAKHLDTEKKFAKITTFNQETKKVAPLILSQGGSLFSAVFLEGKINNKSEYRTNRFGQANAESFFS